MRRQLTFWIVTLGLAAVLAAAQAVAADDKAPDAMVSISEGSVAVGVGWSWGRGELLYGGKTYHFKIEGLSVAEVGVSNAVATGSVYNLRDIHDFGGIFVAASAEGTAGKGAGVSSLRNDRGVVINLKSETKGANIKVAASGLRITLEK